MLALRSALGKDMAARPGHEQQSRQLPSTGASPHLSSESAEDPQLEDDCLAVLQPPHQLGPFNTKNAKNASGVFPETPFLGNGYSSSRVAVMKPPHAEAAAHNVPTAAPRTSGQGWTMAAVETRQCRADRSATTAAQAAAHGVPTVATKNGGPVDIMATLHHGVVVDPTNEKELGDALLNILTHPSTWQEMSKNGERKPSNLCVFGSFWTCFGAATSTSRVLEGAGRRAAQHPDAPLHLAGGVSRSVLDMRRGSQGSIMMRCCENGAS